MLVMTPEPEKAIRAVIGRRIATRLEWTGGTRDQLAAALGLTEAKLARVLKGGSSLTAEQLVWTARVLGCAVKDLLPS